jgi:penicillin amidase
MTGHGGRRATRQVLLLIVVVLVFGVIGLAFLLWRSMPDYTKDLAVAGVSAPVEILRSEHAVPHIFGMTDADVMFGLGYAHAQDRLWQMELLRRTAQGRLAVVVGPAAVRSDELLLRMGLYPAAAAAVAVQEPPALATLKAYAAGVNARIAEADGWGEAAPEFLLFPVEIAPWTPADSLAVLKLLALQLASHVDREVLRARVAEVIPPERLADIQPDDPNPGIAAMPRPGSAALDPGFFGSGDLRDGWSSDAWAVSPARSATGASLLANDPHLNFSAPSAWYLAHLGLEAGDVRGGTIPGIPAVLSGQNPHLAWGLTAANMDDQDVYIERLNPENSSEVLGPAGWVPLREQKAIIAVRGQGNRV